MLSPKIREPARRSPAISSERSSAFARALTQASSWGYPLQEFLLASGEDAPFDLLVTDYSRDGSSEEACRDVYEEIGEHHPQIGAERADVEADMVDFIKAHVAAS
jgi:hypothetical protein